MSRTATGILWFACVLAAGGAAHAQGVTVGSSLPPQTQLNRFGLERAWWNQATLNPRSDVVRHISLDEEIVYVQSRDGLVTAFDSETGTRLWTILLGRPGDPSYPVVSNENYTLVTVGRRVYSLDRWSGRPLWHLALAHQPTAPPAVDERHLYTGMLDGSVYAFDLRTLETLYREGRLPEWTHNAQIWRYKTPAMIVSQPLTTGNVVTFASQAGAVYTVTARERDLVHQFETFGNPPTAPLTAAHNSVYFPTRDLNFYCMSLRSGGVRWRFIGGRPIFEPARVIGDDLYLTPQRGGLYCLSATTGIQKWLRPGVSHFLGQSPSFVLAGDELHNVFVLNRASGAVVGSVPMRNFTVRLANDRTDRVYLVTEAGLVVCLRERGRDDPIYYRFPDRRPILPEFAPDVPADAAPADPEDADIE